MLRNRVIQNLDTKKPSTKADRTDILNAVYDECIKYTMRVYLDLLLF